MVLLKIIVVIGVILTIISGQYSDHVVLFWIFIGSCLLTGMLYIGSKSAKNEMKYRQADIYEGLTGISGFATLILFVWLCIVIWI